MGGSWGLLGAREGSCRLFGGSWRLLRVSRGHLGSLVVVYGGSLGPSMTLWCEGRGGLGGILGLLGAS